MRFLEIITPSRIGGAETHVAAITQGLRALGDEVIVFCPEGRPLVRYLRDRGIEPVTWKTRGKSDLPTVMRFVRLIRERRIAVVHTHLSSATFLGSIAARIAGVPSVATVHGFNNPTWYRFAPKIIAVSRAVKEHLASVGLPESKIEVVYNGIPLERYEPLPVAKAKRACGRDPNGPLVGVFGRLVPEKGQSVALMAWVEVLSAIPSARLILAGDGKDREILEAFCEEKGIASNVEFAGFVPDPRGLMAACDVVVVPSLKEGFGLAAVEAMALERPVIASEIGGLPEIISGGENGLLFPAGDAFGLAEAIVRLINGPELAVKLGKAGRQTVEERFSMARQIAVLRDVLARGASPLSL